MYEGEGQSMGQSMGLCSHSSVVDALHSKPLIAERLLFLVFPMGMEVHAS